jgi:acyl dehydratase
MAATLSIEDYASKVGEEIGVSQWMLIDQDRINRFADVTEDHQYIHVDPEAAAKSPFGGTIAHGYLVLSLLSAMTFDAVPRLEGTKMGINYGMNSLRFLTPVRSGKRIRARFVLKEFNRRKEDQVQSIFNVTVEIEGEEKPAVVAEWVTLIVLD